MPTDMQERINLKLDQCVSIDDMRAKAQSFADEVGCSKTYVLRLIKKREGAATKPDFTVKPAEPAKPESEGPDFLEDIDELEDLDETLFEDKIPEAKPTPTAKPTEQDLSEIMSVENVGTLIAIPFRLIALITNYDGWMLDEDEKKRLSPMGKQLLLKWMPEILSKWFAEVVFAVVVLEVVGEKAKAWREDQREHAKVEDMEKKAQEDIEREKQLAEQQAQASIPASPPESTDTQANKPKTKEQAGTPTWLKEGKRVG